MRNLSILFLVALLAGCATTITVSSLTKVEKEGDYVTVKKFRYGEGKGDASSLGLEDGTYKVEYANDEGYFYRGPGLPVKIPGALNMNAERYPSGMFEGGIFIPKDTASKEYRIYYYQNNLPNSPGPSASALQQLQMQQHVETSMRAPSGAATAGTALGFAIGDTIVEHGRGQIVLVPATSDIDMLQYVSRPR